MKAWLRGEPFEDISVPPTQVEESTPIPQEPEPEPSVTSSYAPPPPEDENRKNFLDKLAALIVAKGDEMEHQLMERKAADPNFQ